MRPTGTNTRSSTSAAPEGSSRDGGGTGTFRIATAFGTEGFTLSCEGSFSRYTTPLEASLTIWAGPVPVTLSAGLGYGWSVSFTLHASSALASSPGIDASAHAGLSGSAQAAFGIPGWQVGLRAVLELLSATLKVEMFPTLQLEDVTVTIGGYIKFGIFVEALFDCYQHWHPLTEDPLTGVSPARSSRRSRRGRRASCP